MKKKRSSKKAPIHPKKKSENDDYRRDNEHKLKSKTVIMTRSSVHGFDDYIVKAYQDSLRISDFIEKSAAKAFSVHLAHLLSKVTPALKCHSVPGIAYRAVSAGAAAMALNDRATFAAGGRLNIGMKQQDPDFDQKLTAAVGGIYASKDGATAATEFQSGGIGTHELLTLKSSLKTVKLIDFDHEVRCLEQLLPAISLVTRVNAIPNYAAWKFQNFPLVSQIIGNWLRLHAGDADGAFFQSTKKPDGVNYLLYKPDEWSLA